ncbi:MAG: hypothetical protein LBS43_05310 [Prevotellaceae bacterium]|jgi:hypothetical protein|nr:hypothetical protein [Prevotellaceae bacterium]
MKQITPMSKKKRCRQILILSICAITLTSCYDIDSLPDRIQSGYELAIPITDTTLSIGEFTSLRYYENFWDQLEIPEGTPIEMGEQSYPFYIGDYSSSQKIEWIEPHFFIESKDFPSGTKINIKVYTKNDYEEKTFFWLPENFTVDLTDTQVRVPETPSKITNVEQFRSARRVYLDLAIIYPVKVTGLQISTNRVNLKFGIRFAIQTNLTINL